MAATDRVEFSDVDDFCHLVKSVAIILITYLLTTCTDVSGDAHNLPTPSLSDKVEPLQKTSKG